MSELLTSSYVFGCTQEAKANAYKALVRPCLVYVCAVWTSYTVHDIDLLELVQNRAVCWIKSYWDPSALSGQNLLQLALKNLAGLHLKYVCRQSISILTL